MADNLAKGSKELEGKGASLEGSKKVTIEQGSKNPSKSGDSDAPKVGMSKINESGKGSGAR